MPLACSYLHSLVEAVGHIGENLHGKFKLCCLSWCLKGWPSTSAFHGLMLSKLQREILLGAMMHSGFLMLFCPLHRSCSFWRCLERWVGLVGWGGNTLDTMSASFIPHRTRNIGFYLPEWWNLRKFPAMVKKSDPQRAY